MKRILQTALLIAAACTIQAQGSEPMKHEVLKSMPAFYEELKATLTYPWLGETHPLSDTANGNVKDGPKYWNA